MHPAPRMEMVNGERELRHDPRDLRRHRIDALGELLLEIRMGKDLHHEKRQPRRLGEPVDPDDPWVVAGLRHLQLVLEQLPLLGIAGSIRHDDLHGTLPRRLAGGRGLEGGPDLALPADADLLDEFQWAELFGDFRHGVVAVHKLCALSKSVWRGAFRSPCSRVRRRA